MQAEYSEKVPVVNIIITSGKAICDLLRVWCLKPGL